MEAAIGDISNPVSITYANSNSIYVSHRCPGTNDAWVLWTLRQSGTKWDIRGATVLDPVIYWNALRPDNTALSGSWSYLSASPTLFKFSGSGIYCTGGLAGTATNVFTVPSNANLWLSFGKAVNSGRCWITLNGSSDLVNELPKDDAGNAYVDTTGSGTMQVLCASGIPNGTYTLVITKDIAFNGSSVPRIYLDAVGLQYAEMPAVGSWAASHVLVNPGYLKYFDGATYTSKTASLSDPSSLALDGMTNGHYIYLAADSGGGTVYSEQIYVSMSTNNTATTELTLEYYDGDSWESIAHQDDTGGFAASGWISFGLPWDAASVTIDGRDAAWLRVGVAAESDAISTDTRIDRICLGRRYDKTSVRLIYSSGSEWEYAFYYNRPGGTSTNVGGSVHGGELADAFSIIVDGVRSYPAVGSTLSGASVVLEQTLATTRADPPDAIGVSYHVWDGVGLTFAWRYDWLRDVEIAQSESEYCYTAMMPVITKVSSTPYMTSVKVRGSDALATSGLSDAGEYGFSSSGEVALWDDIGYAILMSQRDTEAANGDLIHVPLHTWIRFTDATTDIVKAYITLSDGGVTIDQHAGSSLGAVTRYIIGYLADPASVFP